MANYVRGKVWATEVVQDPDLNGEFDLVQAAVNNIDSEQFSAEAVDTAAIATGAVTSPKLAVGAVGTAALAADATREIFDNEGIQLGVLTTLNPGVTSVRHTQEFDTPEDNTKVLILMGVNVWHDDSLSQGVKVRVEIDIDGDDTYEVVSEIGAGWFGAAPPTNPLNDASFPPGLTCIAVPRIYNFVTAGTKKVRLVVETDSANSGSTYINQDQLHIIMLKR